MPIFLTNAPKVIEHFHLELKSIRTGRVNASLLDTVSVEAYGSMMQIKELATITSPEASQLLITPFDKSVNNAIEKALIVANLGANPVNDGAGIRLSFPPLTQEARLLRTKEVDKALENAKVQIRLDRQRAMDDLKKQKTEGSMGEDDYKRAETELQKEVDQTNKELESIAETKKTELLKM